MPEPRAQLLLARHADTAWRGVIRPWLEGSHAGLTRSYVVVPTRGQAQGLKQRCVTENLPLLGVEFLSPGLARQKWLPLVGAKPVLGRELLLFELRVVIARQLAALAPDAAARGLLKSLLSDVERAFDDFDELLKAGFGAKDFSQPPVQEVFSEFAAHIDVLGYALSSRQSEEAALKRVSGAEARIGGRLLVYGLTAEAWGEFFNVAAFVRRFDDITVVLSEPEFRGRRALDENWVEVWQTLLGVGALPVDEPPPEQTCGHIASWWGAAVEDNEPNEATHRSRVLVGRTRGEEMRLVADEVVRLLAGGAGNIAVVFPLADAAQAELARLLAERGVPLVDLLPGVGAPSLETQLLRALLAFYENGGRIDELLALWPLLHANGRVQTSAAEARRMGGRLFDERQTHALVAYADALAGRDRPAWRELHRVASLLLPAWPEELTLADALARFQKVCEALEASLPANWAALNAFAERETRVLPAKEVFAALISFLPNKCPATKAAAQAGFARVTLTTRRRAEGLAWSHVIFVESNAGVWPRRQSASGWLTDEHRALLNQKSRFSLGVFSAEDRAWLEKRSFASLARDTSKQVIFSAALADESEPETALAPNSWLERVLWRTGGPGGDMQEAFERLAPAGPMKAEPEVGVKIWLGVWRSRRDPARAFDEYFFSVDPARIRPSELPSRLVEDAVRDPAALWFDAVLEAPRAEHGPLLRAWKLTLGQLVHRVMAKALRGEQAEGDFFEKPERAAVELRLAAELRRVRGFWPRDRLWDSYHAELARACEVLVENLYLLETGGVMAAEMKLPDGVLLPLSDGSLLGVGGRLDVVIADRADWRGSSVDVVDFKTGQDAALSAERMARDGAGLQLGIYLAALRTLGAQTGRAWLVKPEHAAVSALAMGELAEALLPLEKVARHLATGCYGALTPDRSEHVKKRLVWPLACAPVPEEILRGKYAATFGVDTAGGEVGDDD